MLSLDLLDGYVLLSRSNQVVGASYLSVVDRPPVNCIKARGNVGSYGHRKVPYSGH